MSSSRSVPPSRVVSRRSSSDASEEEDETGAPAFRRSDRDIALSVESASALPTVRIAARRPSRARSARDSIVPARLGNNAGDASITKLQGESDPPAVLPEGPSPWLDVPGEGMSLASDAPPACRAPPERGIEMLLHPNKGCCFSRASGASRGISWSVEPAATGQSRLVLDLHDRPRARFRGGCRPREAFSTPAHPAVAPVPPVPHAVSRPSGVLGATASFGSARGLGERSGRSRHGLDSALHAFAEIRISVSG